MDDDVEDGRRLPKILEEERQKQSKLWWAHKKVLDSERARHKKALDQAQASHDKRSHALSAHCAAEAARLRTSLEKAEAAAQKWKDKHRQCRQASVRPGQYNSVRTRESATAVASTTHEDEDSALAHKRPRVSKTVANRDNVSDVKWKARFEELERWRAQHGHCNVPSRWPERQVLSTWVTTQRTQYKLLKDGTVGSTMTPHRIQALKSLGFAWQLVAEQPSFEDRLTQLRNYKDEEGHVKVPQKWPALSDDRPHSAGLGDWVNAMRRSYRTGTLTDTRIRQLEDLGFHWSLRNRGGTLEERMLKARENRRAAKQEPPPTTEEEEPAIVATVVPATTTTDPPSPSLPPPPPPPQASDSPTVAVASL